MSKTKIMIITLILLISNFLYGQNDNQHYKTIKKINNIEIREFNKSMNVSYYDSKSENYFRYLANYIFGGNVQNEKISMTSPVTMRQYGNGEMIFRLPNKFLKEKAPDPQNKKIKIFKLEPKIKAAIRYSGYTNSKIEKRKTEELLQVLMNNKIEHKNDIEVDVFNSPFQFINRRNEITVTISSDI